MKISIIQMNSTDDKEENLKKAVSFISKCAKEDADLVCLPETFNWLGPEEEKPGQSEPIPGHTSELLLSLAHKYKTFILAGSILESSANNKKCSNTSLLLGPENEIHGKYRKIHLFDAEVDATQYMESEYVIPGKKIVTASFGSITCGLSICYDLRFPELYRALSKKGAEIIFAPSAFTVLTGEAHWETLLRARAIENQVLMIAPAQVGTDKAGKSYYGHSMIVDPWGTVLAEMDGRSEGITTLDVDIDKIEEVRNQMPVLKHRKLSND